MSRRSGHFCEEDTQMAHRHMEWCSTSLVISSVAQSCLTLCDPMDCSMPGLLVYHQFLEFTQTHVHWVGDAIQLSYPLSFPSPPAFNLSQHQGLFQWVSSLHQMDKVLEFQLQHHSFQLIFRNIHCSSVKCKSKPQCDSTSHLAVIKKNTNNKCWGGCGEKGILIHCWWERKLVQPLWKTVLRFFKKTKNQNKNKNKQTNKKNSRLFEPLAFLLRYSVNFLIFSIHWILQ